MLIGVAKETWPGEVRTALVPANATKLIKSGFSIAGAEPAQRQALPTKATPTRGVTIMNTSAEVTRGGHLPGSAQARYRRGASTQSISDQRA